MNPLGCTCPGVPYLAGILPYEEPHWDMWDDGRLSGPEPLATQEDGLCDDCAGRVDTMSCRDRAHRMWDTLHGIDPELFTPRWQD